MSRKDEILSAALTCFTDHGLEGTSIEMIRDLSQASVGSIYHHFGNKQGVAAALFTQGIHSYHTALASKLKQSHSAQEGIAMVVGSYLEWVKANPEWAKFILYARAKITEDEAKAQIETENLDNSGHFYDWLSPHLKSGELKPLPLDVFLSLVLGPSQSYAKHWVSGRTKHKNILKYKKTFMDAAWQSVVA